MTAHLYDVLRERARRFPAAVAFGGQHGLGWQTLTSRQALDAVDRLAVELAEAGVQQGDRVVVWLPSQPRTPIYLFALWKLGAVVVPFDREMNAGAATRILDSVAPRLVINGCGEQPAWAPEDGMVEWWEPGSRASGELPRPWTPPGEELAAIFFTSGTTGAPKGCMIAHAGLCSQLEALRSTIPLDTGSRLASILPLSHLFELTVGLLYPLSCGAAVHYVPSRRGPDIARVLKEQRITHMIAVPQLLAGMGQAADQRLRQRLPAPALEALYAVAERLPLSLRRRLFFFVQRRIGGRLQMLASGGAALAADTQRLWERLGVRVVQGYGASECSPVIACGAGDGSTPAGSVGRPLRGVSVRLGEGDELLTSGPNVMRGYWQDPERTATVLQDGWYATGDVARIDAKGNIFLEGRAKDLIVLPSGMNVWPQDVEDAFRAQAAIEDACVIAVPRPGGGAALHAYLIPAPRQGVPPEAGSIVAAANAGLAPHQRVATASWWPEPDFPRTSTLKVRRTLIPLPDVGASAPPAAPVDADVAVQAIAGIARTGSVRDDQTLGELGLDSLSLVDLALSLEAKSGRSVPEDGLCLEMRVADVRTFLQNAAPADAAEEGNGSRTRAAESPAVEQPTWPYTWGRVFRRLGLPLDLLYRATVTRTIVLGEEHLRGLPKTAVFAGTHHSFADVPLVRYSLAHSPARRLGRRLVIAAGAGALAGAGPLKQYGVLAFGLYPLQQRSEQERSLRGLAALARSGNAVLIFPQGTHVSPERERSGDPTARFRNGAAHLAAALQAPVVPFGVAGTEALIPPDADRFEGWKVAGIPLSLQRRALAIAYGAPLQIGAGESAQAFTARLQEACYGLSRQAEHALAGDRSEKSRTRGRRAA